MKKVFISYSHQDSQWKDRLVKHLKVIESKYYCDLWYDGKIQPGDAWYKEIENTLKEAQIIIMMISSNFLASNFIKNEEVPRILEKLQKGGIRVIPVIVSHCAWKIVPWLAPIQVKLFEGKPLSTLKDDEIEEELSLLVEKINSILKTGGKPPEPSVFIPLPSEKISLSKLPRTGSILLGREKELEILDKAWEDSNTCIVTLVAWGGVGKSALVNEWLNRIAKENFRGAEKVYAWSFCSQGTSIDRQTSADDFIDDALKWFGDPDPARGSPWDKGRRPCPAGNGNL